MTRIWNLFAFPAHEDGYFDTYYTHMVSVRGLVLGMTGEKREIPRTHQTVRIVSADA